MPKIPTFKTEARITAESASTTTNIQIPLTNTLAGSLKPLTDAFVRYKTAEKNAENKTEALELENQAVLKLNDATQEASKMKNSDGANTFLMTKSKEIRDEFSSQASNSKVKTLFTNNYLLEEQKKIYSVDNAVHQNLIQSRAVESNAKEERILTDALYSNNELALQTLPADLKKIYDDDFNDGLIDIDSYEEKIADIPNFIQGFKANRDIGKNPRLAYLELIKGNDSKLYPDLDIKKRQKLINYAETILKDQLRTQWNNVLAGAVVGKDIFFDMDLAKKVLPQIEVNQMLQSQDIARTTNDNKKILFSAPNKDLSELVEQFSDQAILKTGEAKGQIIAQEYEKAANTRIAAIKEDSAQFVYSTNTDLQELNESFNNETNPELKSQKKRELTEKLIETQISLGVEKSKQRVMTKEEAQNFVETYKVQSQGDATKSQMLLQSITINFGRHDSKALQELQDAKLPFTAIAAMTWTSPTESKKMFSFDNKEEQKKLKAWGENNEMTFTNISKEIATNSDFQEIENIVRKNNNIDSSAASNTMDNVQNVLSYYALNELYTNSEFDMNDAINSAVNVFTKNFQVEDTYFIPLKYDGQNLTSFGTTANAVKDKADLIKEEYLEEFNAVAFKSTDPFNQGVNEIMLSEKFQTQMRINGEWRNTADGSGLVFGIVLDGEQFAPVVNANGQELSFNFNDSTYNLPGTDVIMNINKLKIKEVPSEAEIAAIKGYAGFTTNEKELAINSTNRK
tara:strand:- start:2937 stop:5162 length:2226 start_codon:yes stop_codon:yes gene_type:complete